MKSQMMKKFWFAVVLTAMVLIAFPVGLSAKEKVPSPRDDSVQVMGGVEKIKSASGFFEIKLLTPVDTAVSGSVKFEWGVYQTQVLPGEPVTYIFLNGRKFAILRGLANSFTANLQPGEYKWQVFIGMAWDGGSHIDSSKTGNFTVSYNPNLLYCLKVSDIGITVEGVDLFQVVVGRVPHRSTRFSPVLSGGEWWNYRPGILDTLWYKVFYGQRWYPSVDGKALFGPILVDTLTVSRLTAKMQKGVVSDDGVQVGYTITQNYPNPFNPTTTVEYVLPKASEVELTIYNSNGQVVEILYRGYKSAGTYRIAWDGSANSAGTYFFELRASEFRQVIKMNLIK